MTGNGQTSNPRNALILVQDYVHVTSTTRETEVQSHDSRPYFIGTTAIRSDNLVTGDCPTLSQRARHSLDPPVWFSFSWPPTTAVV